MYKAYAFPLTADLSDTADTKQLLFECPHAGRLNLEESFIMWTEATGTQTSAVAVQAIEINDVEVATLTANQSDAIGQTQRFTVTDGAIAGLSAGNPVVDLAAGDIIGLVTKTQASGGTTTGDGTHYLSLDWAV